MDQGKARTLPEHPAIVLEPKRPPETAANIAECSVTADSVVATATVSTDKLMRRIVVQWGDGAVTNLRHRPGFEANVGQESQLPPGTYRLSHTYAAPEDRKKFSHHVTIRVEDESGLDSCIRQIELTPPVPSDELPHDSHLQHRLLMRHVDRRAERVLHLPVR